MEASWEKLAEQVAKMEEYGVGTAKAVQKKAEMGRNDF